MRVGLTQHVLTFVVLVVSVPKTSPAGEWKAGVGRAVITPTTPMWMSGYASRDRPAEGKLHNLWVKALALEDAAGNRAVLVTLDLCGIDRGLSTRVCDRLQTEHRLGRESVVVNCSHTHSGPVVGDNLRSMYFLNEAATEVCRRLHA